MIFYKMDLIYHLYTLKRPKVAHHHMKINLSPDSSLKGDFDFNNTHGKWFNETFTIEPFSQGFCEEFFNVDKYYL